MTQIIEHDNNQIKFEVTFEAISILVQKYVQNWRIDDLQKYGASMECSTQNCVCVDKTGKNKNMYFASCVV